MKYLLKLTMAIIIVIFILGAFIVIGSPMAKACNEDDLTDYSTYHLLVVCTPVTGGYSQNPYYKGSEKCGVIK